MSNEIHLIKNFILDNDTVDLAVEQGKTYNKLILKYPDDLTDGIFYGQIRKAYYEDTGELLGEFNFETALYDSITNKTTIKPYLNAETTQDISYTKYQGIGIPNIKNCWVYDIEYHLNEIVTPIVRGFVQVIPEVTRS
jgi:hypothetical protein